MILVPAALQDLLGVGEGGADEEADREGELLWIVGVADVGPAELVCLDVDWPPQPISSRLSSRTRRHMRQVCGDRGPETRT